MFKDLVEYIVQQLVANPEKASVSIQKDGDTIIVKITVDPKDRGKVIGRDGHTIKALRAFLASISQEKNTIIIDLIQAA